MSVWRVLRWLMVMIVMSDAIMCLPNTRHQVWRVGSRGSNVVQQLLVAGMLDVLNHSGSSRTVRVPPESLTEVKDALQDAGIPYQVLIHDLAAHLQAADEEGRERRSADNSSCTVSSCPAPLNTHYMTFSQMEWYLRDVNTSSPTRITVSSIGKSVEGRNIWLAHILPSQPSDKAVWLEAGLHAREWISPAVALHLIHHMITNTSATSSVDVFIVPMANPDGYVYTWITDRLWRKNRRVNGGARCDGVDLNRNWDSHFGVGASNNPCSEVYQGPSAFSEPETKALRDAMLKLKDNLELVLALHSYGQDLLYPWGWSTGEEAPGKHDLIAIGQVFTQAVKNATGTEYAVKNAAEGYYVASGATDDWAMEALHTKYVYTLELRDQGRQGFLLEPANILACSEEIWQGITQVIKKINA
ncbi:hypothetical protein OTU49_000663 [Cherax quadricarinatus]|uniref:Peptidase M14 domain-containing protein n=3 Tax=Cherax quadricarinatus TaxID=27406 RepID=A0AAW0XKA6_CHEQU